MSSSKLEITRTKFAEKHVFTFLDFLSSVFMMQGNFCEAISFLWIFVNSGEVRLVEGGSPNSDWPGKNLGAKLPLGTEIDAVSTTVSSAIVWTKSHSSVCLLSSAVSNSMFFA